MLLVASAIADAVPMLDLTWNKVECLIQNLTFGHSLQMSAIS
jgi:hypothetical protein